MRRLGKTGLAAALALGCVFAPAGAVNASTGPIVRTDHGLVRGTEGSNYRLFEGIPYAAPPVGALRWKYPQPAKPWNGVRDATKSQARCAQPAQYGEPASESEDCLYLNVSTPRNSDRHLKPVMVWVHGGGFTNGAGYEYDARRLAATGNVIVVTINYRLGIFGNFGMPGLAGSGSFALADQQAALRWTRANAYAFGGNPGNVTLFGESAGGMSTCAQLSAPGAAGLFDKAIMESGSCSLNWPNDGWFPGVPPFSVYSPISQTLQSGVETASELACSKTVITCLRGKSVSELLNVQQSYNAMSYGTPMLPLAPADALKAGRFQRVPVLNGQNRDEHQANASALGSISVARYAELMRSSFGDQAAAVLREYPAAAYTSPAEAWGAVMTDRGWACPTLADNRALSAGAKVYAYEFADRTAPALLSHLPGSNAGAVHGSEIPYLFDIAGISLNPAQKKLSDTMIGYWTGFARTSHLPWSPVVGSQASPYVQGLDIAPAGVGRIDHVARHKCDFWSTIRS